MSGIISSLVTLVSTAWGTIVTWTPVMFAIGFVIVRFALGGIMRIAGIRKRRGGRGR